MEVRLPAGLVLREAGTARHPGDGGCSPPRRWPVTADNMGLRSSRRQLRKSSPGIALCLRSNNYCSYPRHRRANTRDRKSAIAPRQPAFRRTAPQKSAKAIELASAWRPPGAAPNPGWAATEYHNDGRQSVAGTPRDRTKCRPALSEFHRATIAAQDQRVTVVLDLVHPDSPRYFPDRHAPRTDEDSVRSPRTFRDGLSRLELAPVAPGSFLRRGRIRSRGVSSDAISPLMWRPRASRISIRRKSVR